MICYWLVEDFSFGSYIYANDGKMDSGGDDGKVDRNSPIWGKNRSTGFKAWINGISCQCWIFTPTVMGLH